MKTVILQKQPYRLTDSVWLEHGRVHEVLGSAAESLALSVAGAQSGPVVWIGRDKDIYSLSPSALKAFIDPTRILLVEGTNRKERLWSAEQVLRSKGASVVIVQLSTGPDLTESRRLQLACEQGGGIGFILISKRAQSSAAQTRWQCEPLASNDNQSCFDVNTPKWTWRLLKNRAGKLGTWSVSWCGGEQEHGREHTGGYKEKADGTTYPVHMAATPAA